MNDAEYHREHATKAAAWGKYEMAQYHATMFAALQQAQIADEIQTLRTTLVNGDLWIQQLR